MQKVVAIRNIYDIIVVDKGEDLKLKGIKKMKFTQLQIMGYIKKYNTVKKMVSLEEIKKIQEISNNTKYALIKMDDIVNDVLNK